MIFTPTFLNSSQKKANRQAFTLIELLVTTAVMGLLIAAGAGTYTIISEQGAMAREVAAGRSLISAYLTHAADSNGRYMLSFDPLAKGVTNTEGKTITTTAISERYPFRLAPYFGNQLKGTILVNNNDKQIRRRMPSMYEYGVSAFPVMGINRILIGGIFNPLNGSLRYPHECLTHQGQNSTSLIAFVSAGSADIDGYEYVKPPNMSGPEWSRSPWQEGIDPGSYGAVAARYHGKAVCAFTDGSVRLHTMEELRDMRMWSRNAAAENNPDYVLKESL